ncbi:MAG: hypothetical protein CVV41_03525 [Candidatus Riflebacteria bacterium HGW-Riflebacteria-1]|nr:MAG: hypothetical protein CVV41_03525 [Candidatus Riflebacteria bacterium HGW-Riflebacteria-1]
MKARNLILVFIVLVIGLAVAASAQVREIPEPLLGIELDGNDFRITIAQKGGTFKHSFRFDVRKSGEEQFVTVVRISRDECKMVPQREVLTFTAEEVGVDPRKPVFISNSFVGYEFGADMRRYDLEKQGNESKNDDSTAPATLKEKAADVFKKIGND